MRGLFSGAASTMASSAGPRLRPYVGGGGGGGSVGGGGGGVDSEGGGGGGHGAASTMASSKGPVEEAEVVLSNMQFSPPRSKISRGSKIN